MFQTMLNIKNDNHSLQQALCRKSRIESNLRSQIRDLKQLYFVKMVQ